jgi:hypothetical protein
MQAEQGQQHQEQASSEPKQQTCGACKREAAGLQRCARCKQAFYCNQECQRAAWRAGHKLECLAGEPLAKAARSSALSTDSGTAAAAGAADDEPRICRYCLMEAEDGEQLISPCACRGDQRYVHLECLRRWQRSVLVSQVNLKV